ncbi:hypothetical protein D3C76_1137560 [compost metagenome]
MADGDGRSVAARQFDGTIKLAADIVRVGRIVKEHPAFDHLHAGARRRMCGLAVADGHAVEKIEMVAFQRLHDLLHARQAGGHGAAHMVVHAHRKRHVIHRVTDDTLHFFTAHGGL